MKPAVSWITLNWLGDPPPILMSGTAGPAPAQCARAGPAGRECIVHEEWDLMRNLLLPAASVADYPCHSYGTYQAS
jgi:hypothetical protein